MALTINSNVANLFGIRNLNSSQNSANKALQRLSTGLRINSAADDAAGLAIASKLEAKVRGLEQAQRNVGDAISVTEVADGGLGQISDTLIRMRELAVQASNGTLTAADRLNLHQEFDSLAAEIDSVAANTSFNGTDLLDGDISSGITFQIGANNSANERVTLSVANVDSGSVASQALSTETVSTSAGALAALGVLDDAISNVASQRAAIGAVQSRLNYAADNIGVQIENFASAKSRIADADIAQETANLSRAQILTQAGISVVAQSNKFAQYALALL